MKFSTASLVALTAAFAPSLVSAANITVFVGAGRNGQPGNVGFLVAKARLMSDPLQLAPCRSLTLSRLPQQQATWSTSSSAVETTCVLSDLRESSVSYPSLRADCHPEQLHQPMRMSVSVSPQLNYSLTLAFPARAIQHRHQSDRV